MYGMNPFDYSINPKESVGKGITAHNSLNRPFPAINLPDDIIGIQDGVDISGRDDLAEYNKIRDDFAKALNAYESDQKNSSKFKKLIGPYFRQSNPNDRQELVVHFFSGDEEIKSMTAAGFSRLDPKSGNYTEFDEAAKSKALVSARNYLKKEPDSKIAAANWLFTIGNTGESRDLHLLNDYNRRILRERFGDSAYLRKASIDSLKNLVGRHPESLNSETAGETSRIILDGIDSKSREVRKVSVDALMNFSGNRSFTSNFSKILPKIPKNKRTAESLGRFSRNLYGNDPERVIFTSAVIDRCLKESDQDFKTAFLKESSVYLNKYPPNDSETANNISQTLGKHFIEILPASSKTNGFENLKPGEKISEIIEFFKHN